MGMLDGFYGGGNGGSGGGLIQYVDNGLQTSKADSLMKQLPTQVTASQVEQEAEQAAKDQKNSMLLARYARHKMDRLRAAARDLGTHANYAAGAMRVASQIQAFQLNHSRNLSEYQLDNRINQRVDNVWKQDSGF